jgi:hypothetical protein
MAGNFCQIGKEKGRIIVAIRTLLKLVLFVCGSEQNGQDPVDFPANSIAHLNKRSLIQSCRIDDVVAASGLAVRPAYPVKR